MTKKHYAKPYTEVPVGWTIQQVDFVPTEERQGGEKGTFWQGLNINTGRKTCLYKDYALALEAVRDYTRDPKPYARPWGV